MYTLVCCTHPHLCKTRVPRPHTCVKCRHQYTVLINTHLCTCDACSQPCADDLHVNTHRHMHVHTHKSSGSGLEPCTARRQYITSHPAEQAQFRPSHHHRAHWPGTGHMRPGPSCMRACRGHSHLGQEAQHMVRQLGKGRAALWPTDGGGGGEGEGRGPKGPPKGKAAGQGHGKTGKRSPVPQDETRTCLGPSPFHSKQTEVATAIASCPDAPIWPGRASPPSTPSWRLLTLTPIPTGRVGLCGLDPHGKPPSPLE